MKRWIRPWGLAAFLVLALIGGVGAYFIAGPAVRLAVEKAGTAVVGAKVELASARLTISPLGVTLHGLQVTNPGKPMENAVVVDRMAARLDLGGLVRRKVLIQEIAAEGIEFAVPRRTSGALPDQPPPQGKGDGKEEGFSLPPLKVPPVDEILAKEGLKSVERIEALKADIAAEEASIREKAAALPDRAKAEELKARFGRLASGSGLDAKRLAEAKDLRDQIRKEGDKIKELQREIGEGVSALRFRLEEARMAGKDDVVRLREKYALTPAGLANITRALMGPEAWKWADRGVEAMRLIGRIPRSPGKVEEARALPRGRGVDVPLPERRPLPAFWARRMALSLKVPSGSIRGEALDLSSDQAVTGRPIRVNLAGSDLTGGASLEAMGTFDRVKAGTSRDEVNFRFAGWTVADKALSGGDSLPVTLRKGEGTVTGYVLIADGALKGSVTMDLSPVRLEAGGESDTSLSVALRQALNDVKALKVDAIVFGTLDDYGLRLSSDLDRVLKDAVGRAARQETDRLEAGLREAVNAKVAAVRADADAALGRIEGVKKDLDEARARLEEALKQKIATGLPL